MGKWSPYAKKAGVYQIRNMINGMIYIGSSSDISTRWREHKYDLRTNRHRNQHLQNAYNKYGEDAFVYEVLEILESSDNQFEREQYWIDLKEACNKEKGYNIQSQVLVVPKSTKKVVCLETKEVFNSLEEASKTKGISSGSISCCCHKRKLKQAGGYHWRFYDEYVSMTEEEKNDVIFDVKSFPFICIDDGKTYRSWRELPYKKGLISRCCNLLAKGKYATCDNKKYMFLKDYNKLSPSELEKIKELKADMRNSGKVICLETNEVFKNAREAMLKTGICSSAILNVCYKKGITAGGFHWLFEDKYKELTEDQVINVLKKESKDNWCRPVVCLETKEIFKSEKDAAAEKGISPSTISLICKNGGYNVSNKSLHFLFLDEYNKASKREIKMILSSRSPKLKCVVCVETGKVFNSVTAAAQSVGGQSTNISKCCKNPRYTCKGYHWQYIQKEEP